MSSTPRPMLPANWLSRPALRRTWSIRAEVVDLPFDPVTATTRGGRSNFSNPALKLLKNKPISLSTGTPARSASAMAGWGLG